MVLSYYNSNPASTTTSYYGKLSDKIACFAKAINVADPIYHFWATTSQSQDPSGVLQTADGRWHVFPDCAGMHAAYAYFPQAQHMLQHFRTSLTQVACVFRGSIQL